ncbi:MAG: PDZ domain-containing protein [Proteobacteria bacterium]|nr:MAG: PDZ domain-containing protein [Pseudomonadota bacterium]
MEGAMENAATRDFHKLKKGDGGVKVSRIADYSPAKGTLEPGDIILALDGQTIGVDGKIVMFNERISLRALYDLKQKGERVRMEIMRDGVRKKVEFSLTAKDDFYEPGLKYTIRPRYTIVAGLVFSGLTRNYLQEWGRNWSYDAPLNLRYAQSFATEIPQFKGKRDVVVLTERLAHPVNTYAGPFMEEILLKLDGQDVNSVEDIPRIIASSKEDFLVFEFMDLKTPLVLERKSVLEADPVILGQYQVPLAKWFGSDADDSATANWEGQGT